MKELGENIRLLLHWLCAIAMNKCSNLLISHWHWKTSNIFLSQIPICKLPSFKLGLGAILSFLASLPSSIDLIFINCGHALLGWPFNYRSKHRVSLPISSPSNCCPYIEAYLYPTVILRICHRNSKGKCGTVWVLWANGERKRQGQNVKAKWFFISVLLVLRIHLHM